MFNHVMVGSNDIAKSKAFYDATVGALGGKPGVADDKGRLIYRNNGGMLLVGTPLDGKDACGANGGTIGFKAETQEQADAWHKAGVENGGVSVEDPPGIRPAMGIYLAYLRDPSGNKLCAVYRPAK